MKHKEIVKVISQERLADGIYSMWLQTTDIARDAQAGQFISLYCQDKSALLPRPISICQVDKVKSTLRIVYRVVGKGTEEFSKYEKGQEIPVLGPLGNGFFKKDKSAMLIAGGIGIPPMVELAKELKESGVSDIKIVAGYRDSQMFLRDELSEYGMVYVATEDGSFGTKGNVINAIEENGLSAEVIYSCGPTPMLRAVKEFGIKNQIETQISMEERMACGIGACLACVCTSSEVDSHSHVHNKRICADGPVFYAEEVEL